jgi:hypothetical protein
MPRYFLLRAKIKPITVLAKKRTKIHKFQPQNYANMLLIADIPRKKIHKFQRKTTSSLSQNIATESENRMK